MFRGNLQRNGIVDVPGFSNKPELCWSTSITVGASMAMAHGQHLYFGNNLGEFHALDLETGKPLWKFQTAEMVCSTVLIHDGKLYFGSFDGHLYALNAESGHCEWVFHTNHVIFSSPLIHKGHLYFGDGNGYLYSVAPNGRLQWKQHLSGSIDASLALKDDRIYACSTDGRVYCFDPESPVSFLLARKSPVWKEHYHYGMVYATPAIGDYLYFGTLEGHLLAIKPKNGILHWKSKVEGGILASPVLTEDTIYYADLEGCLTALNAQDGVTRWNKIIADESFTLPLISDGERIYMVSGQKTIHAVSKEDGSVLWELEFSSKVMFCNLVADKFVVGCEDGIHLFG